MQGPWRLFSRAAKPCADTKLASRYYFAIPILLCDTDFYFEDGPLRLLGALGVYVDGVKGLAGGHEEAVAFCASETEVGAGFGEVDLAD